MIIRKCSQGHRIRLHRNTTPNAVRTKTYADGTVETLTYPSGGYDYFVEVDGEVVKRSDSFKNIYDSLLIESLVARLAAELCYAITSSTSLAVALKQDYNEKLRLARHADATEGTPDYIDSSTFINSRF